MMSNSSASVMARLQQVKFVLWKSILCVLVGLPLADVSHAQEKEVFTPDSTETIILGDPAPTPQENAPRERVLEAIVSAGGGGYRTFREGVYKTLMQPTGSLDFYLEPGGIGFIVGGHFGYADYFTQGLSFGIREQLGFLSLPDVHTFTEISVLFFDDKAFARSFETGVRLGLSSVFPRNGFGWVARLAGEYRGRMRAESTDPLKPLFWVGLEGGVNFSLLGDDQGYSKRDSLRAALRHILTSDDITQFDQTVGDEEAMRWYERYWLKQDMTPGTPLNEAREEFESRVRYANTQFSQLRRMGVDTDRGRVAIVYGRPNYVQLGSPENSGQVGYHLWQYVNRVKGYPMALFLFESGYGTEYRQIYSNVIGERTGDLPYGIPLSIYQIIDRYDPQ
jgi:GWxTD domain-containing protein